MKPYYQEENITIYHGDCLDIIPQLEPLDLVLTDPPYGVMLGEANTGQERETGRQKYTRFSDTPEYVVEKVIPAFKMSLKISARGIVTPGNRNAWLYPTPTDFGVWYNPAGVIRGKWGFILARLILYYGVDPYTGRGSTPSSTTGLTGGLKGIDHPCPKPLKFMQWLLVRGSKPGEIVFDPFMGSGTTLVAAKELGRKAIGIEIEEKYCEIAVDRLKQEVFHFDVGVKRSFNSQ